MSDAFTVSVALVVALATALPLARSDAWWIRGFEFPRVQIALITAAAWIAYAAMVGWGRPLDQGVLVLLAACLGFQLWRIAPYTRWHRCQVHRAQSPRPEDELSLLVANVLMSNRSARELLETIRAESPDVVLAVETDAWWQEQLRTLAEAYPYRVEHPLDNTYGMHLYSRLELEHPEVHFLVEDDVPSIHAEVVLRSGHRVDLHCVHPAPPSPTEEPTSKPRDAELLVVAKQVDARESSVVVMGDMNDVAWSPTTRLFQRISGLLDLRVGRGMFSTYHAGIPPMRWPLDHVFVSSDFTLVSLERLGRFGSDHFPIRAVLCHVPRESNANAELEPEPGDRDQARAKVAQVGGDEEALAESS